MEKAQDDYKIITDKFIEKYKNKKVNWGFNGLGYVVYKRTYSRIRQDGHLEEWPETIQRCINGAQKIGAQYTKEEAERLFDYIFNLKCNYPGRMLWQLGTSTVDRFGLPSLCNCWFVKMHEPESFCFLFEHLMLGGGVGYSIKREDIHELPKIKTDVKIIIKNTKDADFICPDSREGFIELLRKILKSYFVTGKSFSYSTILVRGKGEKINGFGGIASGPRFLEDGITKISCIFKNREGKKLRSIDVLDICNILGYITVSGNTRRSAQISIGDPDDYLFLRAKRWDLGNIPNWRSMSNNSIYVDDYSYILDEVWNGYDGNGEPYGFVNMKLAQQQGRLGELKKDNCIGLNPCQPAWASILTKSGLKKFKDIKIGDEIWSETGWTKVLNKTSSGIKRVYEYNTTAGRFYGTENHKLVSNNEKIEAKDCESIDIFTGHFDNSISINIQDVMDGLVFGDGSVHKMSNNLVYLCIGEKDYDYFTSEIKELVFKCRPGISDYAYEIITTITSNELLKTYNRSIPDRFIYGGKEKLCGFLRGLFTANGSICGNRVTLKASSLNVIKQVQLMLSSIGIRSYYTTNKEKNVEFSNGNYLCKTSYDLNISTDRDKFHSIIGFIQKYKNDILSKIINISGKSKNNYNIISIDFISEEEVFDITVDNNTHTYWTGGVNVSNCGESTLEHGEPCCLGELYLNNIISKEELIDCSKLLYKTLKVVLTLPSISKYTDEVVKKNFRIGLSVTGICQSIDKLEWLDDCYIKIKEFDKIWSKKNGLSESIKLTLIKPSGTISLMSGSTPGVHPAFARYYIRRIRMDSNDVLVSMCRKLGFYVEYVKNFDKTDDHNMVVIEFPCEAGNNCILAKDMTAIKQLEMVKKIQTIWADQAVSNTIYYKKEELPAIKEWLKNNYKNSIKSTSFLLHKDHGFVQAPYEEITEEKYKEMIKKIKPIDNVICENINGEHLDGIECTNGVCPIK